MSGLGAKAAPAMRWSAASMLTRSAFAVAQLLVLSRLFEPQDFGTLAIVLAIQGLVLLASDLGLSAAIIHFRQLSDAQRSTLFWINLATACALSALAAALAPVLAVIFGEPALTMLVMLVAPAFILAAPWQHLRAVGERDLRIAPLARAEIGATGLGFTATAILAIAGLGAAAAVAGVLVTAAASTVLGWFLLDPRWRPCLVFQPLAVIPHIRYGLRCVGTGMANALGMQGDVLVAGLAFPAPVLGYYHPPREIALRAMLVINPIITRVSFPLIAHHQQATNRLAEIYGRTVLLTASACFPIYAALALFAPQLVEIALGPKWAPSVPLFQALAVWCALRSISNPAGALLLGTGNARRAFALSATTAVLVLVCAWLGAQWGGPVGVPTALAILYAALIIPVWWLAIRPVSGLGFAAYHLQLLGPALCTGAAALAGALTASLFGSAAGQLVWGTVAGGAVYFLSSALLNKGFLEELGQLVLPGRAGAVP